MPPSFWASDHPIQQSDFPPLTTPEHADVAIIGGGYTGLSTALHLSKLNRSVSGSSIRVLEAGPLGWGASGRNGGFVCLGGTTMEFAELIKKFGAFQTLDWMRAQIHAMKLVRDLASEHAFDAGMTGDGHLTIAHSNVAATFQREAYYVLTRKFNIPCTFIEPHEFSQNGFKSANPAHQHGALKSHIGFGLHPMKYLDGLARAVKATGADVHASSPVVAWEQEVSSTGAVEHILSTANGSTIRARRVVMACNGYMPEHLHPSFAGRVMPVMSNIIVTRPLTDAELDAYGWSLDGLVNTCPVENTLSLLYYYRLLPDRRFLFGARGDTTGTPAATERSMRTLVESFHREFPLWTSVPITHYWSGLTCFTRQQAPSIGCLPNDSSVWFGFGYHAAGVHNATYAGKLLAQHMVVTAGNEPSEVDKHLRSHIPRMMVGLPPYIPFPGLRKWYLRAALLNQRYEDWKHTM